ncbi:MAG: hypothetical protein MJK14_05320 [Rivularia sp. ALOHA_DT_140]|nr:hypothetical protein [Rivularia sp. ALOHA_DT_140]
MIKKKNYYLLLLFSFWFVVSNTLDYHGLAENSIIEFTTKENSCSDKDLAILTDKLLKDLPAYFNRATQRARRLKRPVEVYSYMLLAGKPDFTPLPLKSWTDKEDKLIDEDKRVEQIFFTTLERQYLKGKAIQLQGFHRLFLTKTETGWRMSMMYSQTGGYPKQKPPTPPRESSNSAVGQGIKTWLRDCRAGTIKF